MKSRLFRFKQFEVSHSRAALPIGVDGVLIGAWAELRGRRVLDVGTGCGVIALMIAQRYPDAQVMAVDIHKPSVEEAEENFIRSPWSSRLEVKEKSFAEVAISGEKYDLIVSNPPFFDSGVEATDSPRLSARHQGELSPYSLVEGASELLNPGGGLAMIVPTEMAEKLLSFAILHGMRPERVCRVKDHEGAPKKRTLLQFVKTDYIGKEITVAEVLAPSDNMEKAESGSVETHLTMFVAGQNPTPEYRQLCGQFYLKF